MFTISRLSVRWIITAWGAGCTTVQSAEGFKEQEKGFLKKKEPSSGLHHEILPKSLALRVKASTSAVLKLQLQPCPQISNVTAFQTTAWANSLKSLPQSINQLTSVSLSVHTHTILYWFSRILTNTHLSRILNVTYSLWKTDFFGPVNDTTKFCANP